MHYREQSEEFRIRALELVPNDASYSPALLEAWTDKVANLISAGECSFDPESGKLTVLSDTEAKVLNEPASIPLTKKQASEARRDGLLK